MLNQEHFHLYILNVFICITFPEMAMISMDTASVSSTQKAVAAAKDVITTVDAEEGVAVNGRLLSQDSPAPAPGRI